ncbi:hypothetical protein CN692_02285 [Bacillus sp. AFS002410]|uniref:hypothetical protein n=1 Tax=Bacillus sp. AFS002410 TaxID=2033481 RepID=UPI000BEF8200|nr:hypothetical protein [Bacillus sp. AFS002410]PEJ60141.1 hypothetical protein CN692_02285 [Bacillus sp. AFS002410]
MSHIAWIILGALIMSTIDYLMHFQFGNVNEENNRWKWFRKRTKIQKIGVLSAVLLVVFILNFLTLL